jgi:pyruvate dehydrogenase E2 component (dihydrolipoamide acetyltransferase)
MAREVILPKIGVDMTEGKILEWKKKEGDWVKKGDPLFVMETEKVTWEVVAPESGIVVKVMAKAGDVLPVGTIVAYIVKPGEKMPQIPIEIEKAHVAK